MRSVARPTWDCFVIVMLFETLHVVGVALIFFVATPVMGTHLSIMATNGVATLPALLKLASADKRNVFKSDKQWVIVTVATLNVLALLFQLTGLFVWPIANTWSTDSKEAAWALPLGMFLASFGWWETFVGKNAIIFEGFTRYIRYGHTELAAVHLGHVHN